MRLPRLAVVCVLVLGACSSSDERATDFEGRDAGAGAPTGDQSAACAIDDDCVAAGATCCACPTFAARADDPAVRACEGITCPGEDSCPDNVRATCEAGRCVLACVPMDCPADCPSGFVTDATGCLTCACAATDQAACAEDTDCVQTRADCCGCAQGGADTAVSATDQAAFDDGLQCPPAPACPSVDTCEPDAAPRCIQGHCELITGELPSGACGRPDLPACPAGTVCSVNASDLANQFGVGVCVPR